MHSFIASFIMVAILFAPAEKTAIFLVGDSTMANKAPGDAPETGWGMVFQQYFQSEKISVQNHAMNGRSSKSFITEGRWKKVIDQVKPGDWVFIQFGHNDSKDQDTSRYAAPQTTYRDNLVKFISETRKKGGNPVLLTPVMRRRFDEKGKFYDTHGEYPAAVKAVAISQKVPLIDLHDMSQKLIENQGVEKSKALFLHLAGGIYPKFPNGIHDDTHFSKYGAESIASLVASAVLKDIPDLATKLSNFGNTDQYVFQLPKIIAPAFKKDTFDIRQYGAKSNGVTLNTESIAKAISACNLNGGGTVLIPAGFWLTGPIVLKDSVNLHLAQGALVQFSDQYADYPLVKTSWEGLDAIRCQSPISATGATNIAITGSGIVDGAGQVWRSVKKEKLTEGQWQKLINSGGFLRDDKQTWYPTEAIKKGSNEKNVGNISAGYTTENAEAYRSYLRPNLIRFTECREILLDGVTFRNSPAWNLHPMLCDHITIKNLTVQNPWYAQNGDGLDLESCTYASIDNCTFDVGDDGICIKSGRDEEGRKRGRPTENVIVQNSTVFHGHGGFVIGSEMSGSVKNIYVNNCNFLGTDVGLRFKTARGRGGVVENIYVSNINMTNIPGEAILFDMYYMAVDPVPKPGQKAEMPVMKTMPVDAGTPVFQNFNISNVVCKGAETGIMVRGLPEMSIKKINIQNTDIQCNRGFICIEGENINLKNVTLRTKDQTVMQVYNSQNVTLDHIGYSAGKELLLNVDGVKSKNIRLLNTNENGTTKLVEISEKTPKTAFVKN